MKRYISILIALVAITMGAKAAETHYGFRVCNEAVTSYNCMQTAYRAWWYDPSTNVLHLTDGELSYSPGNEGASSAIFVTSNKTLTIQVDGECTITGPHYECIAYCVAGNHTICGDGKLILKPQTIRSTGIIADESTSLTIKDLDLEIETIGNHDAGFDGTKFGAVTLNNCHISISSSIAAWVGFEDSAKPVLENCHLVTGCFVGGGIRENSNPQSAFLKKIEIRRFQYIHQINVSVASPEIDKALASTATVSESNVQVESVNWFSIYNTNSYPLAQGYVAKLGETYSVAINLSAINTDDYDYVFAADISAKINNKDAMVNTVMVGKQITYTFPQLANTYYDVWVGGKQVNDYNQKDVLGDGGSVKYSKTLGFHSLTLENANITNTGNPDYELTGYGRGIYTTMPNLTIRVKGDNTIESKGEGIYFTGNLSILGITDNQGTLSVKGSYGIRPKRVTEEKTLTIGGVDLTAEGTSGAGIGASASFSSGNYNCTMKVGSAKTVVKTKGTSVSLGNLKSLVFEDGLQIVQPSGAYFDDEDVRNTSGIISNQWVVIKYNPSISTGLEAIDNGQLTMDNSLPLYNLQGQRVSHPVKGQIYIQNGRKVIF